MPIYKKGKNYRIDISLGADPKTGKRRRATRIASTKKEAEDIYAVMKRKYYHDEFESNATLSFTALSELFFDRKKHDHKRIYQVNQAYTFNKHILPYFSKSVLKKLTREDILNYRDSLMGEKLSNNTINKVIILLKQIFKTGIEERAIVKNPCQGIKNLRVEKKQMKFWTLEQYKSFNSLINEDEHFLKAFFATAYFTGARCGELLALSWNDILLNHTIDINKTLHNVAGESFYDSPKTKSSIRQVPINAGLYGILLKWKVEQKQIIEGYLLDWDEDMPVFQFREIPPTRNHYTKRIATICKRGTLEPIRLHDFRHSHVALLIEMKEESLLISKRLGYSDYTTTMNIYAHLFPNKQRNLANKLDELF